MKIRFARHCYLAVALLLGSAAGARADELVNIKAVDPSIVVDLRYATTRNVMRRAIYPANMPALVRPSVAQQLAAAQNYLQVRGFKLKIWDAYRPKTAHEQLWQFLPNNDFVANPADGMGSLHTWGVAVDATIVYLNGQEASMPTDFDEFTPAAMLHYTGSNGNVRDHLHILQRAMAQAGFMGMRTEWWHFIAKDWKQYGPIDPATNNSPPPIASNPADPPRRATRVSPARRMGAANAASPAAPQSGASSF